MKKILPVLLTAALMGATVTGCATKTVQETTAAATAAAAPAETKTEAATQAPETKAEAPAATETPAQTDASDPVKEAAMSYFADFPEDRHMISVKDLFAKMDTGLTPMQKAT